MTREQEGRDVTYDWNGRRTRRSRILKIALSSLLTAGVVVSISLKALGFLFTEG